jgi:DNA-directed RNA polymerase subunit RPC12/RpoP
MAAWVFTCANCDKQLAQFEIENTVENYFFPEKPDFPKGGKEFECPNCGHKAMYQRSDLALCTDEWVQFSVCRIAGISSSHNFVLSNILTAPKFSARSLVSSSLL